MRLASILAACSVAGCGYATSDAMRPTSHAAIVGAPDAATVVFVRPSQYAAGDRYTIQDDRGRFLGDSLPASYFVVRVRPGDNVFAVCSPGTSAVRATLAPRKIYFVEVAHRGFYGMLADLRPLTPRTTTWSSLDAWMRKSEAYAPDEATGQGRLSSDAQRLERCARAAHDALGGYDERELAKHTLAPDDGL